MATRTILIVEDQDDVAPLEIALTTLVDVSVVISTSGRDAMALLKARATAFSAVITDLNLPYLDGFELLRMLRADEQYCRIPVVVVSGNTQPGLSDRLQNLGANAFFLKPYSPAELRETMKGLLNAM